MNATARTRRALLCGSMVLGPLCIVVGHLFNVDSREAPTQYVHDVVAHHGPFIAGSVLTAAGAFLLLPTVAGLMRLAPGRGGIVTTVGAVLTMIAAAGLGAGVLMFGTVIGMLTPAHTALAMQVEQIGATSTLGSLPFLPAPGLILGMILIAVGLLTAGTRPKWLPILLLVSMVLVFIAPAGGPVGALMHIPFAAALIGLAGPVWRTGNDTTYPATPDITSPLPLQA